MGAEHIRPCATVGVWDGTAKFSFSAPPTNISSGDFAKKKRCFTSSVALFSDLSRTKDTTTTTARYKMVVEVKKEEKSPLKRIVFRLSQTEEGGIDEKSFRFDIPSPFSLYFFFFAPHPPFGISAPSRSEPPSQITAGKDSRDNNFLRRSLSPVDICGVKVR